MATTTDLEKLVINYLTQDQYDDAREAGTLNANELYLTPDTGSTGGTVTSITAGDGLTGDTITTSGTISHADTSSQSSVSNSGRTYIQSVTLDTYGHVTGLSSATETVTNSDENMKWTASTSSNAYYPLQSTSTAATSTANTLNGISFYQYYNTAGGYRRLDLGNATAWKSTGGAYGTIRLYGAAATYYGDLVPGVLGTTSGDGHISANRTWTLPDKTGTIALTSDIPTVPTKTSHLTNDSGFVTSSGVTSIATTSPISGGTITSTGTISHATSGVGTAVTTAGFYKFKYDTYGHVTGVSSVTASDITGLVTIPTNTDENVKSTAVTAATTNYIVGSTTSTTTTGGLSKHASAVMYTTADSSTGGYTQLRLGNITATSSAGGKEGQIRLYGTNATYYLDLKPGAIASSNKTITFPNKTGTVALTDDIPDVSGFITTDSDEKLKTVALTSGTTYYPILANGANAAANRQVDSTLAGLKYVSSAGTTSAIGTATLYLGNSTASGSANNEQGVLRMYATNTRYVDIKTESTYAPTGARNRYLPSYDADMYLVGTTTTNAVGGATTAPVYVDDTGRIQAVTSIPYSLLTGTPTIPINTDTLMTQAYSTSNSSYPLLMTATSGISSTSSRGATTSILNNQIYANPSTGIITATAFSGMAAATTAYTTANLKNIIESTNAPGTTSAPTGTVWLQYGATPPSDRADYVVEQGTSGIWTYRKWNSGVAECWGTFESSNVAIANTWGNLKYGAISNISFPSGLFTVAPNLIVFLRSTGGRVWATQTTNMTASATGTIYLIAPSEYAAGSTTVNMVMNALGTWK